MSKIYKFEKDKEGNRVKGRRPKAITPPAPRKLTITEAMILAKKEGIRVSRPTVIRLCKEYGVGYQFIKKGHWRVYKDKFLAIIRGELDI